MMEEMNKCMDKLDTLPPAIRKHAEQITEHDRQSRDLLREIAEKTETYAKGYKKLSKEQKSKTYQEIVDLYARAEKLADKKVKIATKMYDLVDLHIKEMDKLSARFGEQQRLKYEQEARKLHSAGEESEGSRKRRGDKGDHKKKRKDKKEESASEPAYPQMALPMMPVVEMPVDPNEPTYCICNQVSFGEMVMCDGKNCRTEWFHFQCVGLTQIPPGKWYCDACDPKKKKK